jgi:hypothetical protein
VIPPRAAVCTATKSSMRSNAVLSASMPAGSLAKRPV